MLAVPDITALLLVQITGVHGNTSWDQHFLKRFLLLVLSWWPSHLLREDKHVCACKHACKSILPEDRAATFGDKPRVNISVSLAGEEEQKWAMGWFGWRCLSEGNCHTSRASPRRAHSPARESRGCSCDSLMMELNSHHCPKLSRRL